MKEWTIMIYMAGDNNLAVDMAYAMEQIKGVAAGADSPNLFVYYDGNSPAIPTLYCDFSEPGKSRYVRSYKVPNKTYQVPKKKTRMLRIRVRSLTSSTGASTKSTWKTTTARSPSDAARRST